MSWLARSLANSLIAVEQNPRIEDDGEQSKPSTTTSADHESQEEGEESNPNRGVKEDLNELSQTLTRQFWGVASFLAPPPSISPDLDPTASDDATSSSPRIAAAIRSDFAEIGGRFRSGISRLSNNLIQFGGLEENQDNEEEEEEEEEESVIGVTREVMTFARNIAMHPETWLDFPLFNEFEDTDGGFTFLLLGRKHRSRILCGYKCGLKSSNNTTVGNTKDWQFSHTLPTFTMQEKERDFLNFMKG